MTSSVPQISTIDNATSVLRENKRQIEKISKDLEAHKKNPNFYRNRKMIAVAAAVMAVAIAALLIYYCGWVAPHAFHISGDARPYIFAALSMPPYFAICLAVMAIGKCWSEIRRNEKTDRKFLKELTDEKDKVKGQIQDRVKCYEDRIAICNAATVEQYSEETWQAMNKLPTDLLNLSLDELNSPEHHKAAWLIYRSKIVAFKKETESMRDQWRAVLKTHDTPK